MAIFQPKKNRATQTTSYAPGVPKRYLCTAKYTSESADTRYLLREVTSPLRGPALRDSVLELFLKDLETPAVTKILDNEATSENDRKEKRLVYIRGKLEDFVIEELDNKATNLR